MGVGSGVGVGVGTGSGVGVGVGVGLGVGVGFDVCVGAGITTTGLVPLDPSPPPQAVTNSINETAVNADWYFIGPQKYDRVLCRIIF